MKTITLLLALLAFACGKTANDDSDTDTVAPEVTKAAAIADAIEANPDAIDEILAKHSMTADSFRDLMYDIAADAKMSADFERARKR
jgi:hypothetical protein